MSARDDQRSNMARARLAWALGIIQNHQGDVVFKKQVRAAKDVTLVISVRLPGVLRISDAMTGDVLAESAPGDPLTLADGFKPPTPIR